MKKLKERISKIDWELVGLKAMMFLAGLILLVSITCVFVKVWVIKKFHDTPISEVPTWAWVWLDK